jgi:transcription elongation GreA/GreB family factor
VESPLGRALLGRRAGDEVVVERSRGPATYEVVAVRY